MMITVVITWHPPSKYRPEIRNRKTGLSRLSRQGIDTTANKTLGFSKIFMIVSPLERRYKRDALALIIVLTNFYV
ncbi:hypothetical protein GGR58DRAFT_466336 [Xylaria digitata]|nr:hypothetical protein GGR58DRAFT_466336 [Xylaria digitata]